MAYVFISDGGPEAEEFDNNYFFFNENNSKVLELIKNHFACNKEKDDSFRKKLDLLCQQSFEKDLIKKQRWQHSQFDFNLV